MKRALIVLCVLVFSLTGCQKTEEKKAEPPQPKVAQTAPAPVAVPEPPKAPETTPAPASAEPKAIPEKKAAPAPAKEVKKEKATSKSEQAEIAVKDAKGGAKTGAEPQKLAKAIPPAEVPKVEIPKKEYPRARPFTMSDIHGNVVNLSDFSGKVVAIEFSATWCPPCMKSAQNMRSIYDRLHEKGLNMCLIMFDSSGAEAEKTGNLVKKMGIPYTVLIDEGNKVTKEYGISVIPTFMLIDKRGRIVSQKTGLKAEEEITKEIEALLN